jgi:hypothetical protein
VWFGGIGVVLRIVHMVSMARTRESVGLLDDPRLRPQITWAGESWFFDAARGDPRMQRLAMKPGVQLHPVTVRDRSRPTLRRAAASQRTSKVVNPSSGSGRWSTNSDFSALPSSRPSSSRP